MSAKEHLCYLHAEHPDRWMWDRLHLPTCPKHSLPSDAAVRKHMAAFHVQAWAQIQAAGYASA